MTSSESPTPTSKVYDKRYPTSDPQLPHSSSQPGLASNSTDHSVSGATGDIKDGTTLPVKVISVHAGEDTVEKSEPGTSVGSFRSRDVHNQTETVLGNFTSGKLTIVVNVASFCRLTQHYNQFNALLEEFPDSLTVLGFPCDQFGHQEPGKNGTEILNTLGYVRPGSGFRIHGRLRLMLKGDVNGGKEQAVYTYLKNSCPQPDSALFVPRECFWEPIKLNDITWNFEKFLIDRTGTPLYRFRPNVEPFDLISLIEVLGDQAEGGRETRQSKLETILEGLDRDVDRRESRRALAVTGRG